MTDEAFINAILANPDDAASVLVYADWLDEKGDSLRAEYLRLLQHVRSAPKRMQEIAKQIDTRWLATVTRGQSEGRLVVGRDLPAENACGVTIDAGAVLVLTKKNAKVEIVGVAELRQKPEGAEGSNLSLEVVVYDDLRSPIGSGQDVVWDLTSRRAFKFTVDLPSAKVSPLTVDLYPSNWW